MGSDWDVALKWPWLWHLNRQEAKQTLDLSLLPSYFCMLPAQTQKLYRPLDD